MPVAAAGSLGAFLKARLAVNGIQCAARSFGTLTAARRGLLSSMGASCVLEIGESGASYQLRCATETPTDRYISAHSGGLRTDPAHRSAALIQNTSASESSVSSHSSGRCGNAASRYCPPLPTRHKRPSHE